MNFSKLLIILFLFAGLSSNAQVNPHAIGVRFHSGGSWNGGELTYQHGFGDKNRLEIDAGGRSHRNWGHFGVAVIFHWVMNITEGLNWYIGPGATVGSYRHKNWSENGLTLGLGGQIGMEYDFNQHDVPLLISLDWRPMFGFYTYSDYDAFGYGGGFSIRYTF